MCDVQSTPSRPYRTGMPLLVHIMRMLKSQSQQLSVLNDGCQRAAKAGMVGKRMVQGVGGAVLQDGFRQRMCRRLGEDAWLPHRC